MIFLTFLSLHIHTIPATTKSSHEKCSRCANPSSQFNPTAIRLPYFNCIIPVNTSMTQDTLIDSKELVVVITGADSGFGAGIAEDLYRREEYTVYATCLTKEATEKYQARDSTRLRAMQVDVTNQGDFNRLRAQVEAECPWGVYCVFNNAGMSYLISDSCCCRCLDVTWAGS